MNKNQQQSNQILIIFAIIGILIGLLLSCNPTKQISNINYINYQEYSIEKFDSICIIDSINKNLQNWHKLELRNYEDKSIITKYMFIKQNNDSINLIYIIEDNKIIKRKQYNK